MPRLCSRRQPGASLARCALAPALLFGVPAAHGFVFQDFNGTGFDYTFDDFAQTPSATGVNLRDTTDGWGGGGFNFGNTLDYSSLTNDFLEIDYTVQPGHGTDMLTLEFYDSSAPDRSIKFDVPTGGVPVGVAQTYTVPNSFGAPTQGIGDFQNFNYASIDQFNLLGQFGSPNQFNVTIDEIRFTGDAPPAYDGQAPDAPWRAQAAAMIDQNRKADVLVNLTRGDGSPIVGANVSIIQQGHAFNFGSAVVAKKLVTTSSSSDAVYRQKVNELFNTVTLENALKWVALEGEFGSNFTEAIALGALDWAAQNDLEARGHVLVWPGYNNLPQSIINLQNDPPALRQAVLDHVTDIATKTQGKVVDWDVVNEPRANPDLLDLFGQEVMDEWFAAADAVNDARLFINEFNIITGNNNFQGNRDLYLSQIQGLLSRGAPIDAIGVQGHFRADSLTGIAKVWDIIDDLHDPTGLPLSITEFDFETTDRQLQADYLRDFMTAVFAHDAVDEFIQWGFWEDAHWRPDAALFESDWTIRPHGQAYLDLVYDEWWTDEQLATDANGDVNLRAFKGDYVIQVEVDGEIEIYNVTVDENGLTLAEVFASVIAGDYNGSGQVEQGDLDLVLQNWGLDADAVGVPAGWINDLPSGQIEQTELDGVLQNWGSTSAPDFANSNVPEPASAVVVAVLATVTARRRKF